MPLLRAPDFGKLFKLMVNASDMGSSAVLMQEGEEGIDHPVCYFSYKFDVHQRTYEKETLTLLLALQQFCSYLEAAVEEVLVYTDNNLLVFMSHMKNKINVY